MNWPLSKTDHSEERDDQTVFMDQEPWLEDGVSQVKPMTLTGELPKKKLSLQQKVMLLGGALTCGLILVMVLVTLLTNRQSIEIQPSPTPVASSRPVNQDPFAVRFEQIRGELKEADPAKTELTFPPVNNEIELIYGDNKKK